MHTICVSCWILKYYILILLVVFYFKFFEYEFQVAMLIILKFTYFFQQVIIQSRKLELYRFLFNDLLAAREKSNAWGIFIPYFRETKPKKFQQQQTPTQHYCVSFAMFFTRLILQLFPQIMKGTIRSLNTSER